MNAIKYLREKRRMLNSLGRTGGGCNGVNCEDCPLSCCYAKYEITCNAFEAEYPEEVVAIVEKWAEEHPQKTMLMDFLDKFPNAKLYDNGIPKNICPDTLGYEENKDWCDGKCVACWNRPIE